MGFTKEKKKYLSLKVQIPLTDEVFPVKFIEPTSKIKVLRSYLELATGIPEDLQVVQYLDEDVKHNDIVNGATLTMNLWPIWKDLVEAVALNDVDWLYRLGVTNDTEYKTPNSEYMTPKKRLQWIQNRADVSLMIASHRGHDNLCQKLIDWGANVNSVTPQGRTSLHFAASQDHGSVINLLLKNGADINITDKDGHNALTLANRFGHKGCERHLFMFRWQERAKASKPQYLDPPPMAFQMCDSHYSKWKSGPTAQVYLQKLLPPGEFVGTALNAPKRTWHRKTSAPTHLRPLESEEHYLANAGNKSKTPQTFEEWVNKKRAEYELKLKIQKAKEDEERKEELDRLQKEEDRARESTVWGQTSDDLLGGGNKSAVSKPRVLSPIGGRSANQSRTDFGTDGNLSARRAHAQPEDLQARIDQLLAKHGVVDQNTELTAYEQWLKRRGLKPNPNHYERMIHEFCEKNCYGHMQC